MEVAVAGAYLTNAVFPHEDGGVGIVENISRQMGRLLDHLGGDFGMALGRDEHAEPGRVQKRGDESPSVANIPRLAHHPWVGRHTQELIDDRPRAVPRVDTCPSPLEPVATFSVKPRVGIRRVDEDVGIDDNHYRPSIA